jgi:hypothetical protein
LRRRSTVTSVSSASPAPFIAIRQQPPCSSSTRSAQ